MNHSEVKRIQDKANSLIAQWNKTFGDTDDSINKVRSLPESIDFTDSRETNKRCVCAFHALDKFNS